MKTFLSALFLFTACISAYAQSDDAPLVQFGDFKGYGVRDATIEEILALPKMKCLVKKGKVTSFDIYGIVPNKEYIGPYRSEADTMDDAQKRYVRSLIPGGKLWINNIHIRYKNGSEQIIGRGSTEYSIYFFNIK